MWFNRYRSFLLSIGLYKGVFSPYIKTHSFNKSLNSRHGRFYTYNIYSERTRTNEFWSRLKNVVTKSIWAFFSNWISHESYLYNNIMAIRVPAIYTSKVRYTIYIIYVITYLTVSDDCIIVGIYYNILYRYTFWYFFIAKYRRTLWKFPTWYYYLSNDCFPLSPGKRIV